MVRVDIQSCHNLQISTSRLQAMKNPQHWRPSKFVYRGNSLRASNDPNEVTPSSRLIADTLAEVYERLITQHARGDLLDLGCGKAPLYLVYRDLTTSQVCVDWERSMHEGAIVDYVMDLNLKLDFRDNTFDTILLTDVLEHISSPEILFDEMARILKTDGKIILSVPFLYWLHEEPYDFYRFTEYKLRQFCEARKLEVLAIEVYGGAPEVILDIIGKNFLHSRSLKSAFASFALWVARRQFFARISIKSRRQFPLGYSLVARKSQIST